MFAANVTLILDGFTSNNLVGIKHFAHGGPGDFTAVLTAAVQVTQWSQNSQHFPLGKPILDALPLS